MEALDDNSILVVTSNPESSDAILEQCSDKISIPILRKYTLKVEEKDLDENQEELRCDFAVFKKGKDYFAISLGATILSSLVVNKPAERLKTKEHMFSTGNIVQLTSGVAFIPVKRIHPIQKNINLCLIRHIGIILKQL